MEEGGKNNTEDSRLTCVPISDSGSGWTTGPGSNWNIPDSLQVADENELSGDELKDLLSIHCFKEDGNQIKCMVCFKKGNPKSSVINMRKKFNIGRFGEHLRSTTHQKNLNQNESKKRKVLTLGGGKEVKIPTNQKSLGTFFTKKTKTGPHTSSTTSTTRTSITASSSSKPNANAAKITTLPEDSSSKNQIKESAQKQPIEIDLSFSGEDEEETVFNEEVVLVTKNKNSNVSEAFLNQRNVKVPLQEQVRTILGKNTCIGVLDKQDLKNNDLQQKFSIVHKYYEGQLEASEIQLKRIPDDSVEVYSLYSTKCDKSTNTDNRCDSCARLKRKKQEAVYKKKSRVKSKAELLQPLLEFLEGSKDYDTDIKSKWDRFKSTGPAYLTLCGKKLKTTLKELFTYFTTRPGHNNKESVSRSAFIDKFAEFYDAFPKFEDTLICDLLKNTMEKMKGHHNPEMSAAMRDFYVLLYQIKPKAAKIVSANLDGPNERTLLKKQQQEKRDGIISNILLRSEEKVIERIISTVEKTFDKDNDTICVSVSIDATKVADLIQYDATLKKMVGGAHPNHCINIVNDGEIRKQIEEIIDKFKDEKNVEMKNASEIKLATLVFQNTKAIPYVQIMARPQTKNEKSSFNSDVCTALVNAETALQKDGWKFSFVCAANDSVSCDIGFVKDGLLSFLKGNSNYCCITDTNHNVKNARYQSIIGGNSVKTVGACLIDTGMLERLDIPKELYIVKDFASDAKVARLVSGETAANILALEGQDPIAQITLVLNLFFMRMHLFAVNCKGKLKAEERVMMLWSSLLFFLHIDGAHNTTKQNWLFECIGLSFLILRGDVSKPHRLTSEPSEHSFAILRGMIREFTVLDFTRLVKKLDIFWRTIINRNINVSRDTDSGYAGTINNHKKKEDEEIYGTVPIMYASSPNTNPFIAASGSKFSMAETIFNKLKPIINKTSEGMKSFLKNICGVNKFHSMMNEFKDIKDFVETFEESLKHMKKKDNSDMTRERVNCNSEERDITNEVENESGHDISRNEMVQGVQDRMISRIVESNSVQTGAKDKDVTNSRTTENDGVILNDLFNETITEKDRESIVELICEILNSDSRDGLMKISSKVITAMNGMHMGKREKGTKDGACSYNTLLGRYYGVKVERATGKTTDERIIQRGTMIEIEECKGRLFLVTAVWKKVGVKWFLSKQNDLPIWKKGVDDKNFRIGVREVSSTKDEGIANYLSINMPKKDGGVVHGENHRDCYRMTSLKAIVKFCGKVDI